MSNKEKMPTVAEVFRLNRLPGDVGIEVEMEGNSNFYNPEEVLPKRSMWRGESDGSLRGYSKEYVLKSPIKKEKVKVALEELKEVLILGKSTPVYSFRAGVHIHLNAQSMTMREVGNLAVIYYCLETALTKFCGKNREGNLFCLRGRDAGYVKNVLEDTLTTGNYYNLDTDDLRYAGMNLRALPRYGSIEFRAMETQPDLSKIQEWVEMLLAVKEAALKVVDRTSIAHDISYYGPKEWATRILGGQLLALLWYEGFEKDLMSNLRDTQTLIYNGD